MYNGKKEMTLLNKLRKSRMGKGLFVLVLASFVMEIVAPTVSLALTSGPSSPEFSSFEPVATTDMVNDFSGDFTYNLPVVSIPGPDGGGYALSLSYHSGVGPEEEASWVGFGWTLNPGAINRSKRGLPDDFNNAEITQFSKLRPNWTQNSSFTAGMEFHSNDEKPEPQKRDTFPTGTKFIDKIRGAIKINNFQESNPSGSDDTGGSNQNDNSTLPIPNNEEEDSSFEYKLNFSLNKSIRYNNYSGFSVSKSFGTSFNGLASLNVNRSAKETTMSFSISPMKLFSTIKKLREESNKEDKNKVTGEKRNDKQNEEASNKNKNKYVKKIQERAIGLMYQSFSITSYNAPSVPYSVSYNEGRAYNYSLNVQFNPAIPVGFQLGLAGHFNVQANHPSVDYRGYGYMYNVPQEDYAENIRNDFENKNDPNVYQTDFQIEKESTFNKHDKYLGIPYNTADVFSASGQGGMGGFRIHKNKIGHFFPNYLMNTQQIRQLGFEFGFPGTIQVGFNVGVGFQRTNVMDWQRINDKTHENILSDVDFDADDCYMRYMADPAGELRYSNSDDLLYAKVDGFLVHRLNLDEIINETRRKVQRDGQSSHIQYAVYDENGNISNDVLLDKTAGIPQGDNEYRNLIAQIKTTGKDGSISTYGIPVFTRNELELTVDYPNTGTNNYSDYVVHREVNVTDVLQNNSVVGQKVDKPWASTYLMTSNTTYDYIDVTGDGPSDDDFGGWTKFAYTKTHGQSENDWYKYRAPYTGLFHNRGRLLKNNDETGGFSSGEKEVYYLKAIETKTHIAFFITNESEFADFQEYNLPVGFNQQLLNGSGEKRRDGKGASKTIVNGIEQASNNKNATSEDRLQKLERIVLFSKTELTHPLSTTHFEYDYSLCQGTPNSDNLGGRLTLKRVWVEGGATTKSRISPYVFEYNYFRNYSDRIKEKYPNIGDVFASFSASEENPAYEPGQLDAWGFFRKDGKTRFRNMQNWVDQRETNVDPAAWQLKRIILPSGGQIHIQYEQKDYCYVQNEKAMVMTSLKNNLPSSTSDRRKYGYNANDDMTKYEINPASIGLSNSDLEAYRSVLYTHFVTKNNKIYYKFLYNLIDEVTPSLDQFNRKTDYITGYTSVNNVTCEGERLFLHLGDVNDRDDRTLPRWQAYSTMFTNGGTSMAVSGQFDRNINEDDDELFEAAYRGDGDLNTTALFNKGRGKALKNTLTFIGEWMSGMASNSGFVSSGRGKVALYQNYDLSYLKLPVFESKKGGGCRVKRLLTYDEGMANETGTEMVYGSEYSYTLENSHLSSGVATNEPFSIREENALVGFMERKKQSGINKLLNGRDSKQFEGPLGENLLPGASIGYSRIQISNIHSGKTSSGIVVNEYYTCFDYPMEADVSELSKDLDTYKKLNVKLPLGMININIQKAWVTQGYVFKLNDMHGKPKANRTYQGKLSNSNSLVTHNQTSETIYEYSKVGEAIQTMVLNPQTNDFIFEKIAMGSEEDISMYRSRVKDVTNDFKIEIDLNVTLPLLISVGFGLSYSLDQQELSQHVTNKVLTYKTHLLKTTSTVDGVTQTTENIAFNRHTGDPVLTRTYDGFMSDGESIYTEKGNDTRHDGHYYSLNIPGSWIYSDLAAKTADNPDNFNLLGLNVGEITTYGENPIHKFIIESQSTSNLMDLLLNTQTSLNVSDVEFNNVVSTSAMVLRNNWFKNETNPYMDVIRDEYNVPESGAQLVQMNRHYYPLRSYVYRDAVSNSHSSRIYGGGLMDGIRLFNWHQDNPNYSFKENEGNWFSPTSHVAYSPNGIALIEQDVLDIYSTVKLGPDKTTPQLVALNADYNQVYFEDFEENGNYTNAAHSGLNSLNLRANGSSPVISNYNFTGLENRGVSIKLWLKSSLSEDVSSPNYGRKNINPQLKAVIAGNSYNFRSIAQTGEWTLYTLEIKELQNIGKQNIVLNYSYASNSELVLIDDLRIQPLDAQMNCMVYHKDKKILAEFDDQHFAVFYEYNTEGLLIRKSIETERGRKVLQEQHQNSKTIQRN